MSTVRQKIFTLICISISIIYYSERDKIQCAFVMEQKKKCGRGTGSTDVRRVGRSKRSRTITQIETTDEESLRNVNNSSPNFRPRNDSPFRRSPKDEFFCITDVCIIIPRYDLC
ncbi:unnamed protein product [Rhizophagus irregularis]|uniref:Uncharacterized protein n=1 Tax=Rhizophagus irregularis TaxID=588596 RepID=A0A2I1G2R4_9GLOM|nr:hypothetical protein RhiirA4_454399 [Rhizophagus irregularis]CAB4420401.1 unnamed protein product [Rhizophagus irregularis]